MQAVFDGPVCAGGLEVAQVSHVQEIEVAIGEGDRLPLRLEDCDPFFQLQDRQENPHRSSFRGRGSPCTARFSSSGEQVAVPIFITTTPPA